MKLYENENVAFTVVNEDMGYVNLEIKKDAVLVIPTNEVGELILISQTRVGEEFAKYEFPSGGINEGETPLIAAQRELNEETGLEGDLVYLGSTSPLNGLVNFKVHIVLAENTKPAELKLEPEDYEDITTSTLNITKLLDLLKEELISGYIPLGLAYYLKYKLSNEGSISI